MSQPTEGSSFFCDVCSLPYDSQSQFEEHQWSMLHHTNMEKKLFVVNHCCLLCKATCRTLSEYSVHLIKDTHRNAIYRRQQRLREQRTPQRRPGPGVQRNSYQETWEAPSSPESDYQYESSTWRNLDQQGLHKGGYSHYPQYPFGIHMSRRGSTTPYQNTYKWHRDMHKGKPVQSSESSRFSGQGPSAGRQKKRPHDTMATPGRRKQEKRSKTYWENKSGSQHSSSSKGTRHNQNAPTSEWDKTSVPATFNYVGRAQGWNEKQKGIKSSPQGNFSISQPKPSLRTLNGKEVVGSAKSVSLLSSPPKEVPTVGEEYFLSVREKAINSSFPGTVLPAVSDATPAEMPTVQPPALERLKGIIIPGQEQSSVEGIPIGRPPAVSRNTSGVAQRDSSTVRLLPAGSGVTNSVTVPQSSASVSNPSPSPIEPTTSMQSVGQSGLLPQVIQKDIRKLVRNRLSKPNFKSSRVIYHPSAHSDLAVLDLKNVLLDLFERPAPLHRKALIESQLKELFIKAGQASDRFKRFGIRLESVEPERDEMIKMLEKLSEEDMEVLYRNESQDILHEILSLFGTADDQSAAAGGAKVSMGGDSSVMLMGTSGASSSKKVTMGTVGAHSNKEVIVCTTGASCSNEVTVGPPSASSSMESTMGHGVIEKTIGATESDGSDVEFIENEPPSEIVVSSDDDEDPTAPSPQGETTTGSLLPQENTPGLACVETAQSSRIDDGGPASSSLSDAHGKIIPLLEGGDNRERSPSTENREEVDSTPDDSEMIPSTQVVPMQASEEDTTIHGQVFKLSMVETKLRQEMKAMRKEQKRIEEVIKKETERLQGLQEELAKKRQKMKTLQKKRHTLTKKHLEKGSHHLYMLSPHKDGSAEPRLDQRRPSSTSTVDSSMSADTSSPGTTSTSTPTRLPTTRPRHQEADGGTLPLPAAIDNAPAAEPGILAVGKEPSGPVTQQPMHASMERATGSNSPGVTSQPPSKKPTSAGREHQPEILASRQKTKEPTSATTTLHSLPLSPSVSSTIGPIVVAPFEAPSEAPRHRFRHILPKPSAIGPSVQGKKGGRCEPQTAHGSPREFVPPRQLSVSPDRSLSGSSPVLTVDMPEKISSTEDIPPSVGAALIQEPVLPTGNLTDSPAAGVTGSIPVVSLGQISSTCLPVTHSLLGVDSLGNPPPLIITSSHGATTLPQPQLFSTGVLLDGSSVGSGWNTLVNLPRQLPVQIVPQSNTSTVQMPQDNAEKGDSPVMSDITPGNLLPPNSLPFTSQFEIPPSAMGISIQRVSDEDLAKLTSAGGNKELPPGLENVMDDSSAAARMASFATSEVSFSAQGSVTPSSQDIENYFASSSEVAPSDAPLSRKSAHKKKKKKKHKKSGRKAEKNERKHVSSSRRQSKRLSERSQTSSHSSHHREKQGNISSVDRDGMSDEDQSVLHSTSVNAPECSVSQEMSLPRTSVGSNLAVSQCDDDVMASSQQDVKRTKFVDVSPGGTAVLELLPPVGRSNRASCQGENGPTGSGHDTKDDAILSGLPSSDTSTEAKSESLGSPVDGRLSIHSDVSAVQHGERAELSVAQPCKSPDVASPIGMEDTRDATVVDSSLSTLERTVPNYDADTWNTTTSDGPVHSVLGEAGQSSPQSREDETPTYCSAPYPVSLRRIPANDSSLEGLSEKLQGPPTGQNDTPSSSRGATVKPELHDVGLGNIPVQSTAPDISQGNTVTSSEAFGQLPLPEQEHNPKTSHLERAEPQHLGTGLVPTSRKGNANTRVEVTSGPGYASDTIPVGKKMTPVEVSGQSTSPDHSLCPKSLHAEREGTQDLGAGPIPILALRDMFDNTQAQGTTGQGNDSDGILGDKTVIPIGASRQLPPFELGPHPKSPHVDRAESQGHDMKPLSTSAQVHENMHGEVTRPCGTEPSESPHPRDVSAEGAVFPTSIHFSRTESQGPETGHIPTFRQVYESIQAAKGGLYPSSMHSSRDVSLVKEEPREHGQLQDLGSGIQPSGDSGEALREADTSSGPERGGPGSGGTGNVNGIDHGQASMPVIKSELQEGDQSSGDGIVTTSGSRGLDDGSVPHRGRPAEDEGGSCGFPVEHAATSLTDWSLSVDERVHCAHSSNGPLDETKSVSLPDNSQIHQKDAGPLVVSKDSDPVSSRNQVGCAAPASGVTSRLLPVSEMNRSKDQVLSDESSANLQPDVGVQHDQRLPSSVDPSENTGSIPPTDVTAHEATSSTCNRDPAQIICKPLVVRLEDISSKMKRDFSLEDTVILVEHSPTTENLDSSLRQYHLTPKKPSDAQVNVRNSRKPSTISRRKQKVKQVPMPASKKTVRKKKIKELLVLGLSPAYMKLFLMGNRANGIQRKVLLDEIDRLTMLKNIPPVAESGAEAKRLSTDERKSRNEQKCREMKFRNLRLAEQESRGTVGKVGSDNSKRDTSNKGDSKTAARVRKRCLDQDNPVIGPHTSKRKKLRACITDKEGGTSPPKVHALSSLGKHNSTGRKDFVQDPRPSSGVGVGERTSREKTDNRGVIQNNIGVSGSSQTAASVEQVLEMEEPGVQQLTFIEARIAVSDINMEGGVTRLVSGATEEVTQVYSEGAVESAVKGCPPQNQRRPPGSERDSAQVEVQDSSQQEEGNLSRAICGLQVWHNKLYAYSKDGFARCYDMDDLSCQRVFAGHQKEITGMCLWYNRPLAYLFTCSSDGYLMWHRLKGGKTQSRFKFRRFDHPITCMAEFRSSLFLALAGGSVEQFNIKTFQCISNFQCQPDVRSIILLPVGKRKAFLFTGAGDGVMNMYSSEGIQQGTFHGHHSPVLCMAVTSAAATCGCSLLSGDADGMLMQHNYITMKIKSKFRQDGPVTCIESVKQLVCTASLDNHIRIFYVKGQRGLRLHMTIPMHDVLSLCLYGRRIYVGKADGTLQQLTNLMKDKAASKKANIQQA